MERLLVLCVGNPLRGDDGFGPAVAARLESGPAMLRLDVRAVHQLTPELAEPLSRAPHAVIVDAAVHVPEGRLTVRRLSGPATPSDLSHGLDPAALCTLARALYGRAPELTLILFGARAFDFDAALTPAAARCVDAAARAVEEIDAGS